MITEARERSTGMVAEAQQKKAQILEELARERNLLEKKIAELRSFERDYRARLKNYIESQLSELDHTGIEPNQGDGEDQGGEANAEG
jgi:chaperonin cofactor prefoldin